MFVLVKDLYNIIPFNIINDVIYKGIHIYQKNDNYYIELGTGLFFSDNTKSKVLECRKYTIRSEEVYYPYYLYVYCNDNGYNDLKLYKKENLLVANKNKANIILNDQLLNNYYLILKDGFIKTNYDISVNKQKYTNYKLKCGDLIELIGVKIVYFDDFLYINSFNNIVKIREFNRSESLLKYKNNSNRNSYYIPEEIIDLEVEELIEYKPIKKQSIYEQIKSIIPNIVMCFSMLFMAYLNISNNNSNRILSYIIMPISMFITGIIIPLIFIIISNYSNKRDNKEIENEYILYLEDYYKRLNKRIDDYVRRLNSHYFITADINNKLFYANKKSNDYLTISVGKSCQNKNICFKKTNNESIDSYIKEIEDKYNNIKECPLIINIRNYKIISIISKKSDKYNIYNKYLLEMSYKHHFDDLGIAIFSTDLSLFDSVYNLPHLFVNGIRLTLTSLKDIQYFDQMVFDKPIVLFMFDRLNYVFSNPNIYVLSFADDMTLAYKNSDLIIEYLNNTGYVYDNKKEGFSYVLEKYNYNKYYSELGKYTSINVHNKIYSFKDVFNKQIRKYYSEKQHGLEAHFAYGDDGLISFDLHESKQGPHGLIGGSTGSGKSEFIISMLLSLCIKYSPTYLNIALIDYKGGGIKESLSFNNIAIPHIVASISNLENNALERFIISIKNECVKRQSYFKKLSQSTNRSIMNIDDYLENNYIQYNLPVMAHLLIVVDEFAELKKENPEQIKELISLSRIGRSLGLHLILATQKPSGVIDDEIWSNSRFKIALKVFDEKDSIDIIKNKDAALLSEAGSFIMLVDGSTVKGKTIYSKNDIDGNDTYFVSLLDNTLQTAKTYKKDIKKTMSFASYYCQEIINVSKRMNLIPNKINFMPPKPANRKDSDLCNKLVFGISDDYINNINKHISYEIDDSILIYSSRDNEINSILNTMNDNNRKTVVIGSNVYKGKCISDSLLYEDIDDIEYLFKTILNTKNNNLSLIIEDISCFLSFDETYLDKIIKIIKRRKTISVSVILLSKTYELNYKLISCFDNKLLICINEKVAISSFFNDHSNYIGKSYYFDKSPISFIENNTEEYVSGDSIYKEIVKRIPDKIVPNITNMGYLLGYDLIEKTPVYSNDVIVLSMNQELLDKYIRVYKGIKTCLYNSSLNIDLSTNILWIGPGIFNQRLFITGLKDDIDDEEGVFVYSNKRKVIRCINNE